jgi:hypothetical protein
MKGRTNDNSTSSTQLPHKFSYIVAILGHNHCESPSSYLFEAKFHFISFVKIEKRSASGLHFRGLAVQLYKES